MHNYCTHLSKVQSAALQSFFRSFQQPFNTVIDLKTLHIYPTFARDGSYSKLKALHTKLRI